MGPHFVHVATPGAWLGEISFLTGQPRRITMRTLVETELFHLPLDVMRRLATGDSDAMRSFAQILVWNVDAAFQKVDILLDPDPARRVIQTLLQCKGGQSSGKITLSQGELAQMANVSRNTVVRVLRDLAKKNWVRTGYGRIEVLEPQKLSHHSRAD
jgi:CRP-like cAMP-binding protein